MAGAGYKLFNTGDVLTAAQVNTYLMEQTVMVFADAAARTTALTGVVSEGMISYLKDTNAVEVYNGSAWVASDDPNAIQNTIVDAKGDLISASAADVPARLAVGNNGETLVADSSATTGLRWQGNYAAGKNKIINGDFGIWQRGTSISLTNATQAYNADRWTALCNFSAGSASVSQQSFTAGTAPVAGYEGQFFWRMTCGSTSTYAEMSQKIEDVRTFAGQTVTVSFWGKASSNLTGYTPLVTQSFGSGGSADVQTYSATTVSLTTSWTRYSFTITLPSISGKTIGTGSNLRVYPLSLTATLGSVTIDFWGVQIEAGNVATAFQTATGTLAGELAACQRYYYRHIDGTNQAIGVGANYSAGEIDIFIQFPVTMRSTPSLVISNGTDYYRAYWAVSTDTFDAFVINLAHTRGTFIYSTTGTAVSSGMPSYVLSNNASASIAFNAEL